MSIDLQLNKEHDLEIKDGDFLLISEANQIAQQVKTTLLTFRGEWFLDDEHGVPYLDHVLIKGPNRAEVEAVLRKAVKDVPGVSSVPNMNLLIDHPARKLKVEIQAETKEGLQKVEFSI